MDEPAIKEGSTDSRDFGLSQMLVSALRHVGHDTNAPTALIERAAKSSDPEARGLAILAESIAAIQHGKLVHARSLATKSANNLRLVTRPEQSLWPLWTALRIDGLASFLLGERVRGIEATREGLSCAWASNDFELIGTSLLDLAEQAMRRSTFSDAFKLFSDAIEHTSHGSVQVVAIHSLGDLFHANNELDLGDGYHQQARKFFHLLSRSAESRLRYRYASTLTHIGQLEQAREEMDIALDLSRGHSDFAKAPIWIADSELLAREDRVGEAEREARRAIAAAKVCGDVVHGAIAAQALVPLLLNDGRTDEALRLMDTINTDLLLSSELERHLRLRLRSLRVLNRWSDASITHRDLADLIDSRQNDVASFHDESRLLREPSTLQLQLDGLDDKVHELEELRRDRDEVVRVMTNEIWPPLKELATTVSLLAQRLEQPQAEMQTLEDARATIQKIKMMSAQLATSGELDAGRVSPTILPVNLLSALEQVAAGSQVVAHSRNVQITIQGSADAMVAADHGLLDQVIANLLAACLRLAPPHSAINAAIQTTSDETTTLRVDAGGPALSSPDRQLLFSKHARIQTQGGMTSGLGLHVAQQLMHAMSGTLDVLPQCTNGGTSFEVRFETPDSDALDRASSPATSATDSDS